MILKLIKYNNEDQANCHDCDDDKFYYVKIVELAIY